jgi:hypothetical protein
LLEKNFETLLIEAVDEALASLGDSAKKAIYFHLKNKFQISRRAIPNHLEIFEDGLEKIFGEGAQFLEILIMKGLYKRIGKEIEWHYDSKLVFSEYITAAKNTYIKTRTRN